MHEQMLNLVRSFDVIFPREYLRAVLMVSLLSVWLLVGLFYYLNRYTQRSYFTIWTASWLFYALWLTLGITMQSMPADSFIHVVRQWCVSISAVFLLWGSLQFLGIPTRQTLFGLFMGFLLAWSYVTPYFVMDSFLVQMPIFMLIGMASIFAAITFHRMRRRRQFVGVGMLFFGFLLWGLYLITYPFTQKYEGLICIGFLFSAVLELFIAVSMIVLVLEEARYRNEDILQQIEAVNSQKQALELKVISTEEECRRLFQETHLRHELQKAYDELRQTQQSVVQQERLRALGQMASGIAHDVNNALSPILAFSDLLLRREPQLSPDARRHLEHIHTASEDIAQIVSRMSEFHRRREDNEQVQPIDLNTLVKQVVALTRPRWRDIPQGKGIMIEVESQLGPTLPELLGNASEVREALTNLILNAVDALPEGGRITLATRALWKASEPDAADSPSQIVLEVRDNGIGMDESTRRHCLEPFFSTKKHRGGTGLGLAMVYGTMERHQGRIEIESEPGKGATMRLIFPARTSAVVTPPKPSADTTLTPTASLRVLCIDDEPLLRELLGEILRCCHHEVETADGGQAGVDAFIAAQKAGHPFDVVVTDLGMPHIDGRQVTEQIKAISPATPVILLTGWGTMLDEDGERQSAQVDAVVCKPPRRTELNETLLRVAAEAKQKDATVQAA